MCAELPRLSSSDEGSGARIFVDGYGGGSEVYMELVELNWIHIALYYKSDGECIGARYILWLMGAGRSWMVVEGPSTRNVVLSGGRPCFRNEVVK